MKLIDLLNCMNPTVVVTITIGADDWDFEVCVSSTKLERIPQELIQLIGERIVKDIYTINDVIKINIE